MKRPNDLETDGVRYPVSFPAFIPTFNHRLERGVSREVAKIVAQFVQALRSNGVTECDKTLIVKRQGIVSFDYVDSVVSVDEILVAAPLYDWACTWDNDGYPVINFGNGLDGTSLIGGHVSYEAIVK